MKRIALGHGVAGLRLFIAMVLIAGSIAMGTRGTSAQDGVSGSTFTSPIYGFSLTWDPATWNAQDSFSYADTGAEGLLLSRVAGPYSYVNVTTYPADGSQGTCEDYQPQNASSRNVQVIEDYGTIPASAAFTPTKYQVSSESPGEEDEIHYVLCAPVDDQGNQLRVVFIVPVSEFDGQIPVFAAVLSGLTFANGETGAAPVATQTFTDPEFGFTLTYNGNDWGLFPSGGSGISIKDARPNATAALLTVYGTSDYGTVADCIADASTIANSEPGAEVVTIDGSAALVEKLGADAQVVVVTNTFDPTNDSGARNLVAVGCAPLSSGGVLVVSVASDETRMAAAIETAKTVLDTIKLAA